MPFRPIVRLGHPALRTPAQPVELERLAEPEIQTLIDEMFETMRAAGGVGLAAPQLGIGLQLFVYAAVDPDRPPISDEPVSDEPVSDEPADGDPELEPPELKVLVNPALEPVAGELVYDWEGCLSISDLRGLVPRHPAVRVHAIDRQGQSLEYRAEGYEARILQHEYDHLNGIVFLDRMRDLHSLAFGDEWEEYMTAKDEEGAAVG